ncbi:hypothetical protein [Hespellia stercorisuis]|uniref:hypothetical protein n=1 Tax=Hespellia stercorisuis TaxID=180311 RepID=UPI001160514C|nr:hypothetical protein [Hespellia stercorisuis]
MQEIAFKLSNPQKYTELLNANEIKIGRMEMKVQLEKVDDIEHSAKIELVEMHTHCLETFVRLFIARAKDSGCEWLELNRLSIRQYHQAIDKISNGEFQWLNDKYVENYIIQYSLTGIYEKEKVQPEVIENWKEWIIHAARQLSENKRYNAFKHGMTLHAATNGISMKPEGEDTTYEKHGDVIEYIVKKEESDRYVWNQKSDFINMDELCIEVYLFGNLINDMVYVGKYVYVDAETIDNRWYPNEKMTINEVLYNRETKSMQDVFELMSSMSMQLLYYVPQ